MSNINKNLKAYVRYDAQGNIVGGGPIIQSKKPATGKWVEIPMYQCCITPVPTACEGPYWINYSDFFSEVTNGAYAVSQGFDSNCNVYGLTYVNNSTSLGPNMAFSKYASDGSLIWTKTYEPPSIYSYDGGNNMSIGSDGSIYASGESSILKVDSNGDIVWQNNLNGSNFYNGGIVVDRNNEYVYLVTVNADLSPDQIIVSKFNATTGAYITEKTFIITDLKALGNPYVNSKPLIDSEGNLIFVINSQTTTNYYVGNVFKCDSNLNVIWAKRVGVGITDCDTTGLQLDADDNIYGVGYFANIYKIDKNGNLQWVTLSDTSTDDWYAIGVSPSGDVYLTQKLNSASPTALTYVKLDTNGIVQWGTRIDSSLNPLDSATGVEQIWDACTVVNNSVTIVATARTGSYGTPIQFKLPFTQVLGTYGAYTFSTISPSFSFISTTLQDTSYTTSNTSLIPIGLTTTLGTFTPIVQTLTTTTI